MTKDDYLQWLDTFEHNLRVRITNNEIPPIPTLIPNGDLLDFSTINITLRHIRFLPIYSDSQSQSQIRALDEAWRLKASEYERLQL